jgi:hypothetical protein
MRIYKTELEKADRQLFRDAGKHWHELEPDGWYDARHYRNFINGYVKASPAKENAMITLGKQIYLTVKQMDGFPPGLKTPIDYLEFEAKTYLEAFQGAEISPRKFIKKYPGYVIIQTKMTEQDCKVVEGVYRGIMRLAGVSRGKIQQAKCIKNGDAFCEFHILWNAA